MMLLLLACGPKTPPPPPEPTPAPGQLTILHTNDLHGHYLPEPAEWITGRPAIGGFERLDAELTSLRKSRLGTTLLLDGGDINTGTPLTDLVVHDAKGGAMLDFMQLLHYDAWAVGNHEFDKGIANLGRLTAASPMPVLSSNLLKADGSGPLLPKQELSHIFSVNGLKIGVIGATTEGLKTLMSPSDWQQVKLQPVAEAVAAEVKRLDPETDLIVVLSHIGEDDDLSLAAQVPGIDLIVGGHSHTRMTQARQVNGTWVVQAGSYTRSLGIVDLVVSNDAISQFQYELRDLLPETAPGPANPAVTAMANDYKAKIDAVYGEVVGQSPALMGRSYNHESALGRWITDALRGSANTDIGLYNGGGLRADMPAGPIHILDIYQCFPFGNQVMTFNFTGSEVMGLVTANMAAEAFEKRGFLSISGLSYTWHLLNGAPEALAVNVNGKQLNPDATYTVAANSYITDQWEKHLGAQPRNLQATPMNDFEVAVSWARSHPIADPGDIRATRMEK